MDWQLNQDVTLHYVTSEIVEIRQAGEMIRLKTEQADFVAEMTLRGYRCDQPATLQQSAGAQRLQVHGHEGVIVLRPEASAP